MEIKTLGISKVFQLGGEDYRNVKIEFSSTVVRDITVKLPITVPKLKEAVKKYWDYHKKELKEKISSETDPITGQTFDIPELDE